MVDKNVRLESKITINKPLPEVFDYVRHIRNQDNYSVWNMQDPGMKKDYIGTDGQVGFIYRWNGNNKVGEGEQEIKRIVPNERVDMELRFKRPMEDTAQSSMTTAAKSAVQTEVSWSFNSRMKFPMTIMKPMMVGMLNKALKQGLHNLKSTLEK
jgi:hypothetical protein